MSWNRRFLTCPFSDCATCVDGYAQGSKHTCFSCAGEKATIAIAWAVVAPILILGVGAVVVWDLTGVRSHSGERPGRVRKGLAIFRHRFVEALPMGSVKILVVIWQIVTQVQGGIRRFHVCFILVGTSLLLLFLLLKIRVIFCLQPPCMPPSRASLCTSLC